MAEYKEIFKAFFEKTPKISKKSLNPNDYEYMNSLSAAIIHTRPKTLHWVLMALIFRILLC